MTSLIKMPILLAVLIVVCAGCATIAPKSQDTKLEPQTQVKLSTADILKFEDVPIPVNFRLAVNESFIFENSYSRIGILKYAGKATPDRVVEFYKEQMPLHDWNLVNILEYGRRILNYEKAQESCIITVETSVTKTTVTISVAPRLTKQSAPVSKTSVK